jgi:uncharacterized RDD family membrane protein YckC
MDTAREETMNGKENPIELLVICALMLLLSIVGIVGSLSTPLRGNLDGLLMLAVCLMTALIFAILLFVLAKQRGWLGKRSAGGGSSTPAGK